MRLSRGITVLMFVLALAGQLPAEGMQEVGSDQETITVTDFLGREVVVPANVERVATLGTFMNYGIVVAIGAKDMIVGTSTVLAGMYASTVPDIMSLPTVAVSGMGDVDYEQVFELGVDLVIVDPTTFGDGTIATNLEPEIAVYVADVRGPAEFVEEVSKLGLILNREDEAATFLQWYQEHMDSVISVTDSLVDEDRPKVFSYYGGEWGVAEGPPFGTYGSASTTGNSILDLAGGQSITVNLPGEFIALDAESVIEQDPDFIIREVYSWNNLPIMGFGIDDTAAASNHRDVIMGQDAFLLSTAVQNDELHLLYGDVAQGFWFVGLTFYAKMLHPDLFPDLDPEAIFQDFLTKFLESDYDVSANGVFVYPAF